MTSHPSTISVTDAKAHFSEIASRAAFGKERFMIAKKGKPLVVLLSAGEYEELTAKNQQTFEAGFLEQCRLSRLEQRKRRGKKQPDSVPMIRHLRESRGA